MNLRSSPERETRREQRGVEVQVLRTGKAVERYNRLAEDRPVGALIHSTC